MRKTHNLVDEMTCAHLVATLSDALSQFASIIRHASSCERECRQIDSANDNEIEGDSTCWPDDPMTLAEVVYELRLKQSQIVKLRRVWGFPEPTFRNGGNVFSRREINRWVILQPNPRNLAAVLRLRTNRMYTVPLTR
jgi:hypothetical protein